MLNDHIESGVPYLNVQVLGLEMATNSVRVNVLAAIASL